jgi:DNA-binding NtrC family response regulator
MEYDWPGNIRELENMIKRLVILQDEQLVFTEIERSIRRFAVNAAAAAAMVPNQVPVAVGMAVPEVVGVGVGGGQGLAGQPPSYAPASPEPADSDEPAPVDDSNSSLASVAKAAAIKAERAIIEKTLGQVHWNRRKAAQILGVSYKTLLNKIKECNITRD